MMMINHGWWICDGHTVHYLSIIHHSIIHHEHGTIHHPSFHYSSWPNPKSLLGKGEDGSMIMEPSSPLPSKLLGNCSVTEEGAFSSDVSERKSPKLQVAPATATCSSSCSCRCNLQFWRFSLAPMWAERPLFSHWAICELQVAVAVTEQYVIIVLFTS